MAWSLLKPAPYANSILFHLLPTCPTSKVTTIKFLQM